MKHLLKVISLFIGLSIPIMVIALPLNTLYTGSVPVQSQSASLRSQGLKDALAQVFVKVSGSESTLLNSHIQMNLNNAKQFLQEYSYQPENKKIYLNASFDSTSIDQVLREAGAPIWGANRPLLAIWVLVFHDGSPELLHSDSQNILANSLERNAQVRGVPVIFPLLDIRDLSQVSVQTVQAMQMDVLEKASERYNSSNVLVGVVNENHGAIQSHWQLAVAGDNVGWQFSADSESGLGTIVINTVADMLAKRFAVWTDVAEPIQVKVNVYGVNDLSHYAKMLAYWKKLKAVTGVQVEKVNAESVTFLLTLQGSEQSLMQAVLLTGRLTPMRPDQLQSDTLNYQLKG